MSKTLAKLERMRTLASVYSSMNASNTKAMKMLRTQVTVTMWKERK